MKKFGAPLKSWDIFMDAYLLHMANGKDMQAIQGMAKKYNWATKLNLQKEFTEQKVVVITDTHQNIVFASHNIYGMTGYTPEEMLNKTPRMLQGPETDKEVKQAIRQAIEQLIPITAVLVNYRKNGEKYNCRVEEMPIFNKKSEHTHFIAFEQEVYGLS